MKLVAIALAALAGSAAALRTPITQQLAEHALRAEFETFVTKYSKTYETAEERETRFWVFVSNLEDALAKNAALKAEGKDEVFGVTKFSDMTKSEFQQKMLNPLIGRGPVNNSVPVAKPTKSATASSFDWRDSGVVTAVKNQGYCGSCWAHSAVETVESAYARAGGSLTALSVQQVVSCDTTDAGCNGGWYYTAWDDYIEGNGGLNTEANYPYDQATFYGSASSCDTSLESSVVSGTKTTGYSWATTPCSSFSCNNQDEDTLKSNLVSYGPISIACDASEWSSYTSGVFSSSSCSSSAWKLDHAIQLVGYNAEASTPYWIVRNSWDTNWGQDGYIYLEMGVNACGIADKAAMVSL
jgi:cysteine peptidase B